MSMQQKALFDPAQLARFASVGVINSGVGYAVILAGLFFGLGDFLANATGYAVGLIIGFVLNRHWAFSTSRGYRQLSLVAYGAVFCLAYGANLGVIITARSLGFVDNPLTHLAAMAVYSGVFYLGLVAATSADETKQAAKPNIAAFWPEAIVAIGVLAALVAMINIPLSHDVVWQTWIARQILGGAELYRDILEINPPLWFWMAMPSELFAEATGLTSKQSIIIAVFAYAASALAALAILFRTENPLKRLALFAAAAVAMLLVALPDFGQREQLALIGAIPYAALIAQRRAGQPPPFLLAVVIGLLAAPAFALKHYFVAIAVLLEIWLLVAQRKNYRPIRPETLALGISALIYGAAVVRFAPGFFDTIIPMVQLAYHGYQVPFWVQFVRPHVFLWFVGLFVFAALPGKQRPLALACLITALGFMLAYFLQQKGWRYHSLAASGALLISLIAAMDLPRSALIEKLKFAFAALLAVFGLQITLLAGPYTNSKQEAVTALLANTPAGSTVMMVSASPSTIWPMVDDLDYIWPSRHFAYWMLSAIAQEEAATGTLSPEMAQLADDIRTHAAEDLWCHPPDIILVDDHSASTALDLDAIAFFSEDTRFAELFSHYAKVEKISRYTSYVRSANWQPKAPSHACRKIY